MIVKIVPTKLLRTVACMATMWATFMTGSFQSSQEQLKFSLKDIRSRLGLPDELKDHLKSDPQYKNALNFLGAWFMGDQIGEIAVGKGVGISESSHVKHIQTLLPFLRKQQNEDLSHEIKVLETALNIHEIIQKLTDSALNVNVKSQVIQYLNDFIFAAAEKGDVLIPISWKGSVPGSILISLGPDRSMKVYDTTYEFNKNEKFEWRNYPTLIEPFRDMITDQEKWNRAKNHKFLILSLIILSDADKLAMFVKNKSVMDDTIQYALSFAGFRNDIGYKYFQYIFLPMFGAAKKSQLSSWGYTRNKCIKWPHRRDQIGPLADVLSYFTSKFTEDSINGYYYWKLDLSYEIMKSFLYRFGSDSDIHLEARDQNVIHEIANRSANRLLRDTIEMATSSGLIPDQASSSDNDIWIHLHENIKNLELLGKDDDGSKELENLMKSFHNGQAKVNEIGRIGDAIKAKTKQLKQFKLTIKELKQFLPKEPVNLEKLSKVNKDGLARKNEKRLSLDPEKVSLDPEKVSFDYKSIFDRMKELSIPELIDIYAALEKINLIEEITPEELNDDLKIIIYDSIRIINNGARFKQRVISHFLTRLRQPGVTETTKKNIKKVIEVLEGNNLSQQQKESLIQKLANGEYGSFVGLDLAKLLTDEDKNNLVDSFKTVIEESVAPPVDLVAKIKAILVSLNTERKKLSDSIKNDRDEKLRLLVVLVEQEKKISIDLIGNVVKLHEKAKLWLNSKGTDTHKLSKISRSLGQREMPLKKATYFGIFADLDIPLDLNKYKADEASVPDLNDCMAGSSKVITSLDEFIDAFAPFNIIWKWFRFTFEIRSPQCKPYQRRNAEILLRNLNLGGFDRQDIKKWTPKSQKHYKLFLKTANSILGTIVSLPNTERTLEDYIIILRLQRVIWRVAQALDLFFSKKEPQRHLDLLQYSLSYPQCRKLLKGQMTYSNYFLADSGAFGNILSTESVTELNNLCKELIDEENAGKPVLNVEKYMAILPVIFDRFGFDRTDPGDREIYYKMAQNPLISRVVRENHEKYNYGQDDAAGNAARAVSVGEVGGQFIYYQFFDALKIIFTSNIAIEMPVLTAAPVEITYVPLMGAGSALLVLPSSGGASTTLLPVNEELIKKEKKSYIKTAVTEMVTSHILGLDVIMNHLGRGSAKFWSSGSIVDEKTKVGGFSQYILDMIETLKAIYEAFTGGVQKNSQRMTIKAFRRDVAGSADFFLNCSSHLIRKLDVAPKYEELVMALLMKTFKSVNEELLQNLKELEKRDIADVVEAKSAAQDDKDDGQDETGKNEAYLKNSKTTLDEFLQSLINWSLIAVRFAVRIRSLKPELKNSYPDVPSIIYSAMSQYSTAKGANNRLLVPLDQALVSHVDYVLFMICLMNPNDLKLREVVSQNLKPETELLLPKDSSVMTAAMVLHRFLALNSYEYNAKKSPITQDFISQQYGITQVMSAISSFDEHNKSFLMIMAQYMTQILNAEPDEIIKNYYQGDNLKKGFLNYGRFSINLIQGTLTENGRKARNPNDVLRNKLFRQFFSSGSEQLVPTLGYNTVDCPKRYEIVNFLKQGTKYSVCEFDETKKISIYRHIPKFNRPCMLVLQRGIIDALQYAFSIYPNNGVDIYHCKRGNNAHFVWIGRDSINPMYVSHGRLWFLHNNSTKMLYNIKNNVKQTISDSTLKYLRIQPDFEFNVKTVLTDQQMEFYERLLAPTIFFPKLEIIDAYKDAVFPLTAESKMMVIPEPMVRFSSGSRFGTYSFDNNLIFMFQQFRFRDRPEVAMTFVEGDDGILEMKGRKDLKVCEDQIFENDFWPALMMKKDDKTSQEEIRFAYVPISNPEIKTDPKPEMATEEDSDDISVSYDPENLGKVSLSGSSQMIFMEAMSVQKVAKKGTDSAGNDIYEYKLKPTSRLQRILLAYYQLKLRNYEDCLKIIDPRNEIDHNTELDDDEKLIFNWMVNMHLAQDPEALALRFMAKIHLILDEELFPVEKKSSDKLKAAVPSEPSNLGAYFEYIHVLPKRFQINQVFRDTMTSKKVIHFIKQEYETGIFVPGTKSSVYDGFKLSAACVPSSYVSSDGILSNSILEKPSKDQEKKLDEAIKNRFTLSFIEPDCDLLRMMSQRLLHIFNDKSNKTKSLEDLGLVDLQELALIYLQFAGNERGFAEKLLLTLLESNEGVRNLIDLKGFIEENTLKYDKDGKIEHKPKTRLGKFGREIVAKNTPDNYHYSGIKIKFDVKAFSSIEASLKSFIGSNIKQNFGAFTKSYLSKKNDQESDDQNSLKFTKEDFCYISAKDQGYFSNVMRNIDDLRDKDKDPSTPELNVIGLKFGKNSKTQVALQQAIEDYGRSRRMPVYFDELVGSNPFKEFVEEYINSPAEKGKEKLSQLKEDMANLELRYKNLFKQMKFQGEFANVPVLAHLKRAFDLEKKPNLADLRDCFMQMKRSCLQDRLPELSDGAIVSIAQILKDFYIRQILFNNLNAVVKKIGEFDKFVRLALEAESKLKTKSLSQSELEKEIFGYKDAAFILVEDIYNDMEKLALFELRLQDPVTLNFEFMSAKFHLTSVQVEDIANLATRHWEDDFRNDVRKKRYTDLSKVETRIANGVRKYKKLIERYEFRNQGEDKCFVQSLDKLWPVKSDEVIDESKTIKMVVKLPNNLWPYLPRDERKIKEGFAEYYTHRPRLAEIRETVGKLKFYDPEKDSYISRVIQRKMAAGKTTVLGTAATVKKADGKTLSVLVILSSLYQSSAPDMQKRTSDFFKTRGFAFSMPKPRLSVPLPEDTDHVAKHFLEWTLTTIVNTINSNSYLVVTPETLQAFLNSYVEYLDAYVNAPPDPYNQLLRECLQLFATIYDIFRTRGSLILDEIDSSMRPQKELNFPTNKRDNILNSAVKLTSDLLLFSAMSEKVKTAGLHLLANQQASLNDDQYQEVRKEWRKYIKEQLKTKDSIWQSTFFTANFRNLRGYNAERLVKFFFDPSALDAKEGEREAVLQQEEINFMVSVQKLDGYVFHAMMIVKMQLKDWLKNCFKGAVNEHYGPAINRPDQKPLHYAIPYLAAKTPAEGSIFADRWETVNKTLMMYLVKDLSLEDISLILLNLRDLAISGNSTLKDDFAQACPEKDLLSIKFNPQNKIVDKENYIMKCMKARSEHSLKLIFYWVAVMIFEKEQFFAEQITSNAINMTTMFPSVQGYSGTIDNVNILPHQVMIEAEADHKLNEQANGAITMKLFQQKNCVTTVQKIETYTEITSLLDQMCRDTEDLSIFSAFVDVGALLKDYSNADVALALAKKFNRKTVLYYNEFTNQLSFLEYDPNSKSERRATLEGSETNYLNSATSSTVDDRFTYYDQRHITGSDILQPPTAKAFLTIGPKVLLRDILQGVMRMRQFQSGQSIHFITTSAVEAFLDKYCENVTEINDDGKSRVNQKHLIALGAFNEDEKQLAENVRLYRVKIDAEIRAFVMDIITEFLAQYGGLSDRYKKLFEATRPLFIRNVNENPVNWATINTMKDTDVAVREFMESRIKLVHDSWKQNHRWIKVKENLDYLIKPLTNADVDARSVLNYLGPKLEITAVPEGFKTPESEVTSLGSELQMELQLELQQELQLELEQQVVITSAVNVLPEPELNITGSPPPTSLNSNQGDFKDPKIRLDSIEELLTPWKLINRFNSRKSSNSELMKIFNADIFCTRLKGNQDYCLKSDSFVGMTLGIAKVSGSDELDFLTMMSREATHLLFWRGMNGEGLYKYAVFLVSGSEAYSLHKFWNFRSCLMTEMDSYWLTDLYGFEVHGNPLANNDMSSKKYSLLESEYFEHFEKLHFRALLLNGSYNVLMASRRMLLRFRVWVGDKDVNLQNDADIQDERIELSKDDAASRAKFFISKMSWMGKLRDEIVPQDPFIEVLLRITAKAQVSYQNVDSYYVNEHISHSNYGSIDDWKQEQEQLHEDQ